MLKRILACSLPIGAFLAVGLASPNALSDILPALGGHSWFPHEAGCFQTTFSEVRNGGASGCTGLRKWLMAVPVRSLGTRAVSAQAWGSGFEQFNLAKCRAVKTDGANSATVASGGWVNTTGLSNSYQPLNLGNITLNNGDALNFECDITPGGKVVSVSWAQ